MSTPQDELSGPERADMLLRDAVAAARDADPDELRRAFIYRTVAKFTPGYLIEFSYDEAGRTHVAWASEGFEEIYGCTLAEYKRRAPGWSHPPESAAEAQRRRAAVERGERVDGVKHVLRDDGTSRWLYIVIQPLRDATSGRLTRAVGIAHDITEAVLTNRALRESQSTLESIAGNSPDWLVLLDAQRRINFINRPIFGLPTPKLIGLRIEEAAPRHDRRRVRGFVQSVLNGRRRGEYAQTLEDPQRGTRKLILRARPVKVDDRITGAVLSYTEVTDQVRRDQMLGLQASVLATMEEGVALIDRRGSVELCNGAFSAAFGAKPGALIGKSVSVLAKHLPLRPRRGRSAEIECTRVDATKFTAHCLLAPIPYRDHHHSLLVLTDVTERKRLERQVLEAGAREQQRIAGELHDGLGQELTGIALLLRGLAARPDASPQDVHREINEVVGHLNRAINTTRALARGLAPAYIAHGGLIEALRSLVTQIAKSHRLRVRFTARIRAPLAVDDQAAVHIYRIAQEAVLNAVRHARPSRITVTLSSSPHAFRLRVVDDGRGLPRKAVPTARGVGLEIMRYRARTIGGDLKVTPGPGRRGTVVCCERRAQRSASS